jgi:hypothetical protein
MWPIIVAPKEPGLAVAQFTQFFDHEEKDIIESFWDDFNGYLRENYMYRLGSAMYNWIGFGAIEDEKKTKNHHSFQRQVRISGKYR